MKKVLCIILVLVMLLGLASCSSEAAKTSTPTQDASTTQATEQEQELDYVELKMIALGDSSTTSEDFLKVLNEMLKADLNCELEIEYISWSDWTTKYPLVFASGEKFDLVYTSNWASYASQAQKGAFYELTESDRQTYMPMTCAALGEDGWKQAMIGGKVFMVPTTPQGQFNCFTCFGVRGDLMKEFGMESIDTAEDMLTYWDNVLEKHPEMIPINITNTSNAAFGAHLARNFIESPYYQTAEDNVPLMINSAVNGISLPLILDVTDYNNVQYVDQAEADKYYITVFEKARELQQKGYWSADALTITEELDVAYNNGKSASTVRQLTSIENYNQKMMNEHPEWEPTIVRFVDDPYVAIPGLNNGMGISATSENPERAMMVLDLMGYDQKYYDLMHLGIEGTNYSLNEDGTYVLLEPFNEASAMGFENTPARVSASASEVFVKMRAEAIENSIMPPFSVFSFDHSSCETEVATMQQVMSKYFPILSLGMAEDVEATYQEMIKEMKVAGMDTVKEEYLKQVQEFYSGL